MNPRALLDRLRGAVANLSLRERVLVFSALGALLLAIVYLGVVMPALSTRSAIEQRITSAEQQLQAMVRLRREFDDVNGRLSSVESRIANGSKGNLRTTLESLARQAEVKIQSMEPQASPANERYKETKVALGLEGVTLEQAVKYLHQIENHRQVLSVKSLRLRKRADKGELLDVNFTVSSFEPV